MRIMHGTPGPTSTSYTVRREAERRRARTALIVALAASAVVHTAALFLLSFKPDTDAPRMHAPAPRIIAVEPVMRAYDVAVVGADAAPIEEQLREQETRARLAPVQRAWGVPEPAVTPTPPQPDDRASVSDRLRYRMGSTEVWRPQDGPRPVERSADEVVRDRVAAQLQEYNDSVAAESAARARATDWTVKDGNGGRWGVSPGAIHLGAVTLPLPFEFRPSPEVAGRVRSWTEIQQQAARVEGQEIFDERVRAIRERAEAERARRAAAGGG
jgi:hypothetical protein